MQNPSITLETKCWEKDWKVVLDPSRLARLRAHASYPFDEFLIFINNCEDVRPPARACEKLVRDGIISGFHIVAEHEKAVLEFFRLERQDFGSGYYYSIAELTALFLCTSSYLLHFAGDVLPQPHATWINGALALMDETAKVKVANLTWNDCFDDARHESFDVTGDWYISQGFSDQNYLVRTSDFRAPIYGETNPAGKRYPQYGGESFEKRVDAWMRNHFFWRATHRHLSYIHPTHRHAPQKRPPWWRGFTHKRARPD